MGAQSAQTGEAATAGSSFGPWGAGIGAAAGIGMGIISSIQGNKAVKRANAAAMRADAANKTYIDLSRQANQSKLGKEYGKLLAREAALSSARGTLGSSSSNAAQMSALANALTDSGAIDFNARAQKNQSSVSIGNQILQNSQNFSNPFFSAIKGGMSGAMTGYQLGGVLKEFY